MRIVVRAQLAPRVCELLEADPAVSTISVLPGESIRPRGDVVLADAAREAANDVIEGLRDIGVHEDGP